MIHQTFDKTASIRRYAVYRSSNNTTIPIVPRYYKANIPLYRTLIIDVVTSSKVDTVVEVLHVIHERLMEVVDGEHRVMESGANAFIGLAAVLIGVMHDVVLQFVKGVSDGGAGN